MDRRRSGLSIGAVAVVLIAGFAVRATLSTRRHSVTIDEYQHLPAGLVQWRHPELNPAPPRPPLGRMLIAAADLGMRPVVPAVELEIATEWQLGESFLQANREQYRRLFDRARGMNTLLGCGLCAIVFAWARRIQGDRAGLGALAVVAFEPHLLAHSSLATTDTALCLGAVATLASFGRLLEAGGKTRLVATGLVAGLALLTKVSALCLLPATLAPVLSHPGRRAAIGRWAGVWALALVVLNCGYRWHGSFRTLPELAPHSRLGRRIAAAPWTPPLPLPAAYVERVDAIQAYGEQGFPTYLDGRVYLHGGPWYLDLETLALRLPLGELGLYAAAVALGLAALRRRRRPPRDLVLAGSGIVLVLLGVSTSRLDGGLRYALLAIPLAAVAAGFLVRRARVLAAVLLAVHVIESVAAYPHELAFFQRLAGGPGGSLERAVGDADLGQDLPALAAEMRRRGIDRVALAYQGRVDPALYGIDYELPAAPYPPGWYAISASYLVGLPYLVRDPSTGARRRIAPGILTPFRRRQPVARAGATIYLYRLGGPRPPGGAAGSRGPSPTGIGDAPPGEVPRPPGAMTPDRDPGSGAGSGGHPTGILGQERDLRTPDRDPGSGAGSPPPAPAQGDSGSDRFTRSTREPCPESCRRSA